MSEEKKDLYIVVSKFAHFKEGDEVKLTTPVPTAAMAHVKLKSSQEKAGKTANEKALENKVAELEAKLAEATKPAEKPKK